MINKFLMYKQNQVVGLGGNNYLLLEMYRFIDGEISYGYIELRPETMEIIRTGAFGKWSSVEPSAKLLDLIVDGFTFMKIQ